MTTSCGLEFPPNRLMTSTASYFPAEIGGERVGGDEHASLHHLGLGKAKAAQDLPP